MHVLLVEDDDLVASGIQAALEVEAFAVNRVATVAEAEAAMLTLSTDLVVLDIGLPDGDGLELLRGWRAADQGVPVLLLTARDAVADRVAGLSAGGDDYLLKPFDLDELLARVNALLRRAAGFAAPVLTHGAIRFDSASRDVWFRGKAVSLTRRETALLERLLHAGSRVITTEQLKDSLYGFDAEIEGNALSVHIHNLRRKLGHGVVETVRGVGYRLGPAESGPRG